MFLKTHEQEWRGKHFLYREAFILSKSHYVIFLPQNDNFRIIHFYDSLAPLPSTQCARLAW